MTEAAPTGGTIKMELSLSKQPDIHKELVWFQKEPLEMLWSSRIRLSGNRSLVSLRTHALRLLRIFADLANNGQNNKWEEVYARLHSAVSLTSIGVNSDLHEDGFYCGAADHEEAISRVRSHFLAGTLVFQFAWNAFEAAGKALSEKENTVSTQAIRHKLAEGGYRPMYGFEETVLDAHRVGNRYIDINHCAYRESIAEGNYLCVAAEQLRQFRNGILHGEIQAMVPLDWGPESKDQTHEDQTELFHTHIRLVLFLLQEIIARVESEHVMVWPNEGVCVEDLISGIQKEAPKHFVELPEENIDLMCLLPEQRYVYEI